MATIKTPPYFSELSAFHSFIGNYVLTVIVSIVAMLAFETPFVKLDRFMFRSEKKIDKNNSNKLIRVERIQNKEDYKALKNNK